MHRAPLRQRREHRSAVCVGWWASCGGGSCRPGLRGWGEAVHPSQYLVLFSGGGLLSHLPLDQETFFFSGICALLSEKEQEVMAGEEQGTEEESTLRVAAFIIELQSGLGWKGP